MSDGYIKRGALGRIVGQVIEVRVAYQGKSKTLHQVRVRLPDYDNKPEFAVFDTWDTPPGEGGEVEATVRLGGREYNGKWYATVVLKELAVLKAAPPASTPSPPPSPPPFPATGAAPVRPPADGAETARPADDDQDTDDIPF